MADNTKIARCTCVSAYQDKKYGNGMRVFNRARDGWRCTVDGKVVPFSTGEATKTEVKPKQKS